MFMKGIYLHHITVFSGTEITIALGELVITSKIYLINLLHFRSFNIRVLK